VGVDSEVYWVKARSKRSAAGTTARHVRGKHGNSLVRDRVVRVLAPTQWGEAYFDFIQEEDTNGGGH